MQRLAEASGRMLLCAVLGAFAGWAVCILNGAGLVAGVGALLGAVVGSIFSLIILVTIAQKRQHVAVLVCFCCSFGLAVLVSVGISIYSMEGFEGYGAGLIPSVPGALVGFYIGHIWARVGNWEGVGGG
jgi:hypothetical protein